MRRCCVRATLHSGLGNWLYVAVEVALVAAAQNCTLALPSVLHQWFRLPVHVQRPVGRRCRSIRSMQEASSNPETRTRAVAALGAVDYDAARAQTFRTLFSAPVVPLMRDAWTFQSAVHLRTVSDVACHTYDDIRACRRVCLRTAALECVVQHARPPVLILSDSAVASAQLKRAFADHGVRDGVWDESAVADARNHSAHSRRAAHGAMQLWTAFAMAERRFASGISTFSKAALLARPALRPEQHDFVVDTRCFKGHPSDGELFTCRPASLSADLVR